MGKSKAKLDIRIRLAENMGHIHIVSGDFDGRIDADHIDLRVIVGQRARGEPVKQPGHQERQGKNTNNNIEKKTE